jgi:hypothetical protein
MLKDRGARFSQVIHPTCLVTRRTTIGEGVVLGPYTAQARKPVSATSFDEFLFGAWHDSRVGAFSTLSAHVDVMVTL